ncbi:hypothetical protein N0V88_007787 [Collariella sp. IMI 366227]|nr:hypothetical protein N0V88_007787 [Collariella sp. IMI 366227]
MLAAGDCSGENCHFHPGSLSYGAGPGNAVFLAAFAALALPVIYAGLRYRTDLHSSLVLASLLFEIIGHVGRALLVGNPTSHPYSVVYLLGTHWGAILLGSAVYLVLPHVIVIYGQEFCLVSDPVYLNIFFLIFDIFALNFQQKEDIADQLQASHGVNVLLTGLAFQAVSLLVFLGVYRYFRHRLARRRYVLDDQFSLVYLSRKFKYFMICVQIVACLLLVRTAVQIAIFANGPSSPFARSPLTSFLLDDTLILAAAFILTAYPAGRAFGYTWAATSPAPNCEDVITPTITTTNNHRLPLRLRRYHRRNRSSQNIYNKNTISRPYLSPPPPALQPGLLHPRGNALGSACPSVPQGPVSPVLRSLYPNGIPVVTREMRRALGRSPGKSTDGSNPSIDAIGSISPVGAPECLVDILEEYGYSSGSDINEESSGNVPQPASPGSTTGDSSRSDSGKSDSSKETLRVSPSPPNEQPSGPAAGPEEKEEQSGSETSSLSGSDQEIHSAPSSHSGGNQSSTGLVKKDIESLSHVNRFDVLSSIQQEDNDSDKELFLDAEENEEGVKEEKQQEDERLPFSWKNFPKEPTAEDKAPSNTSQEKKPEEDEHLLYSWENSPTEDKAPPPQAGNPPQRIRHHHHPQRPSGRVADREELTRAGERLLKLSKQRETMKGRIVEIGIDVAALKKEVENIKSGVAAGGVEDEQCNSDAEDRSLERSKTDQPPGYFSFLSVMVGLVMLVWGVSEAVLHSKRLSEGYGSYINGGHNGLGSVAIFETWSKFLMFGMAVVWLTSLSILAVIGE